jgi:hypothetical protein
MFERRPTIIQVNQPERTQYVDRNVTVHEHRAPTDQSVALLKEMEEKAERKILNTIHVTDSSFECVVHMWWDAINDAKVMRAVWSLNGHKCETTHTWRCRRDEPEPQALTKAFAALRDKIATEIATKIIAGSFNAISRQGK